jgi:hypothetical protein
MQITKQCERCHQLNPFSLRKCTGRPAFTVCNPCRGKQRWRKLKALSIEERRDLQQAPAKKKLRDARYRFNLYGISESQAVELLQGQSGRCAICEREGTLGSLCIDHDHETGIIRGILCKSCNRALGQFGDNLERVRRAVCYLEVASSERRSGHACQHKNVVMPAPSRLASQPIAK